VGWLLWDYQGLTTAGWLPWIDHHGLTTVGWLLRVDFQGLTTVGWLLWVDYHRSTFGGLLPRVDYCGLTTAGWLPWVDSQGFTNAGWLLWVEVYCGWTTTLGWLLRVDTQGFTNAWPPWVDYLGLTTGGWAGYLRFTTIDSLVGSVLWNWCWKIQVLAVGRIVWTNMAVRKIPRPSTAAEHIYLTNKAIQNISWVCTTVEIWFVQLMHQNASPSCRRHGMGRYGHRKITAA